MFYKFQKRLMCVMPGSSTHLKSNAASSLPFLFEFAALIWRDHGPWYEVELAENKPAKPMTGYHSKTSKVNIFHNTCVCLCYIYLRGTTDWHCLENEISLDQLSNKTSGITHYINYQLLKHYEI